MTRATKPVTRQVTASVPHGVKPEIAVTIYPGTDNHDATIGLREYGRRKSAEYFLDVGRLYVSAVQAKVAVERMKKGKARAAERKLRRLLK